MMPSREVVHHFENAAAGYGMFRNAWPLSVVRRQEWRALETTMRVRPHERVLDAGCGDGEILVWLAAQGVHAVGIDISTEMAKQCRQRGLLVSVQDLEAPAFRAVFDGVVCFGALEFAEDPARAIAGLAATLRPGGRFALLFPKRSVVGAAYAMYHRLAHGIRVHLFRAAEIVQWMRQAGLNEPTEWQSLSLSVFCVADLAERRV